MVLVTQEVKGLPIIFVLLSFLEMHNVGTKCYWLVFLRYHLFYLIIINFFIVTFKEEQGDVSPDLQGESLNLANPLPPHYLKLPKGKILYSDQPQLSQTPAVTQKMMRTMNLNANIFFQVLALQQSCSIWKSLNTHLCLMSKLRIEKNCQRMKC